MFRSSEGTYFVPSRMPFPISNLWAGDRHFPCDQESPQATERQRQRVNPGPSGALLYSTMCAKMIRSSKSNQQEPNYASDAGAYILLRAWNWEKVNGGHLHP